MQKTTWIRMGITLGAAGVLAWRLPPVRLIAEFRQLDVMQLLPAASCVLAMLAVRAYKWHALLSHGEPGARAEDSLRSLLGGFALALAIPGRLGEFGRCLFTPPGQRHRALLLNALDRLLDMWALLTVGVASLFVVVRFPAAIFGVGVWLAAMPLLVGLPALLATFVNLPPWPEGLRARLAAATSQIVAMRVRRFAVLSVASTALDLMLFYFLLRAFYPVGFDAALATFPWIVIAGGLPLSINGFGVREGVAALLLARYGLSPAAAADVGLLLFTFSCLLPAVAGGIWLLASGSSAHGQWPSELETIGKGIWNSLRPAATRPANAL
ncbi:MAG: flippase-like domain-containing protein [Acidobacteriia bacterium]|nr:flippase-like domain-containing protein [Terriglobia bacterium]